MAYRTYIIGFAIKSDETYQQRYNSLMTLIDEVGLKWKEPTSFVSVHVNETLSELSHRLFMKSNLITHKDVLIVVDTQTNQAKYYGPESRKPGKFQFDLI